MQLRAVIKMDFQEGRERRGLYDQSLLSLPMFYEYVLSYFGEKTSLFSDPLLLMLLTLEICSLDNVRAVLVSIHQVFPP